MNYKSEGRVSALVQLWSWRQVRSVRRLTVGMVPSYSARLGLSPEAQVQVYLRVFCIASLSASRAREMNDGLMGLTGSQELALAAPQMVSQLFCCAVHQLAMWKCVSLVAVAVSPAGSMRFEGEGKVSYLGG